MTYQQRERKQECVAAMRAYAQHANIPEATVKEYVQEATHQDRKYWYNFTPEEAIVDLQLYVDNTL